MYVGVYHPRFLLHLLQHVRWSNDIAPHYLSVVCVDSLGGFASFSVS
jgi:hypothetical protein